jgi:maltose alpha-D-glucosyltransferase/alpha-amylase
VSAGYLREYLLAMRMHDGGPALLPPARHELRLLLDAYLLEKTVYELVYELNNRPDWVRIPMQGILQLVDQTTPA